MPTTITVELQAICDDPHGPWLCYNYGNEYIPNGEQGGTADFVENTRARAKAAARKAGWKLPTRAEPETLCPTHAQKQRIDFKTDTIKAILVTSTS